MGFLSRKASKKNLVLKAKYILFTNHAQIQPIIFKNPSFAMVLSYFHLLRHVFH